MVKRIKLSDSERAHTRGVRSFDALTNLVSGLGTASDKMTYLNFTFDALSAAQLEFAYRGDWIARKAIDIPAQDATREWRSWQADKDYIEKLEAVEKKFQIQRKLKRGLIKSRLYGGAAIILGVDQGLPSDELRVDRVGVDQLRFVHVVSRYELNAGPINMDILSPYYGEPEYYDRHTADSNGVRLHPSRVIRLIANERPDLTTSDGWGDSVMQSVHDAIRAAGMVSSSVATMVDEAKLDVIQIPDLTANILSTEYVDALKERFNVANVSKSVYRTLLLDKEEIWNRIKSDFNGLPEILKLYLLIVSGAVDIPATRFLSQSPQGLSATGESDIRNYYDRVANEQKTELSPSLERLDQVLIRSALGSYDPDIYYNWNSLWQMTPEQKADLENKKANTFKIDVDSALIDPNVLRQARINQLIEDGTYPGLEQIVEEWGEQDEIEMPDPNEPDPDDDNGMAERIAQADTKKKIKRIRADRVATNDARPRTLYVYRPVLNASAIRNHFKRQGFGDMVPANAMHVTIAYSKEPVDWIKAGEPYPHELNKDGSLTIQKSTVRLVERLGPKAVCLLFVSNALSYRHWDIRYRADASWEWDDYQPHITLTYDATNAPEDLDAVEPWKGEIRLGPEVFEEITENAVEMIVEDGAIETARRKLYAR